LHMHVLHRTGRRDQAWQLVETRQPGETTMQHDWQSNDERLSLVNEVPAVYVPSDLIDWAYYLVAAQADPRREYRFAHAGTLHVHHVQWVSVTAVDWSETPDDDRLSVWVRTDSDPAREQWLFTTDGRVSEVRFATDTTLHACTQQEVARHFRDLRHLVRTIDALP
jgi:hypothetical protein